MTGAPLSPGMRAHRDRRKRRVVDEVKPDACSCVVVTEETHQLVRTIQPRGMLGYAAFAQSELHARRLRRIKCFACEVRILRTLMARERKGGPGIPLATRLPRIASVVAELAEEVPIGRDEILELLGCGRTIYQILSMADDDEET